jgi:hypothetical protein
MVTCGLTTMPMPAHACSGWGPEYYGNYPTRQQCVADANYLMSIGAFDCYNCTMPTGQPPLSHLYVYYD